MDCLLTPVLVYRGLIAFSRLLRQHESSSLPQQALTWRSEDDLRPTKIKFLVRLGESFSSRSQHYASRSQHYALFIKKKAVSPFHFANLLIIATGYHHSYCTSSNLSSQLECTSCTFANLLIIATGYHHSSNAQAALSYRSFYREEKEGLFVI